MSLFNHETDEEQKSDKKIKTYYFSTKNMKNLRGWYEFGATSAASNTGTVAYFNENYFPVQHKKNTRIHKNTNTQHGKSF